MPAPLTDALCCECGNRRTVTSDYSRPNDPNYSFGINSHPQGWRRTQTLKCLECGTQTRHAILVAADSQWRDRDERAQRVALGEDDPNWGSEYAQQLRHAYRQMPFPRNPILRHRYYVADATKAWDEGHKTVTALCGEPDTIETDPRVARH